MGKNIATTACTFELTPPSTAVPPLVTVTKIVTPASTKVKAGGNFCYFGDVIVSISGYIGGTINSPLPTPGVGSDTLKPSSKNVKIEAKAAVLEGDSVTITVNGFKLEGDKPVPAQQKVKVTIKSAGQTSVKAN